MAAIGGIITLVGGIGLLILWIVSIVKAFKKGDTLWGVLNIIFAGICGLIWFYMNGEKKLGNLNVLSWILYLVGGGLIVAGAAVGGAVG